MDDEMIAKELGFVSAEEMDKYYDLCWMMFKSDAIKEKKITKELAEEMVRDNDLEDLLTQNKEDRLFESAKWLFDGLTEAIRMGNEEEERVYKEDIEFILSEAKKSVKKRKI